MCEFGGVKLQRLLDRIKRAGDGTVELLGLRQIGHGHSDAEATPDPEQVGYALTNQRNTLGRVAQACSRYPEKVAGFSPASSSRGSSCASWS
jgi:hypothetical protein